MPEPAAQDPQDPAQQTPPENAAPEKPAQPANEPETPEKIPYIERLRSQSFQQVAESARERAKKEEEEAAAQAKKPKEDAAPAENGTQIDPTTLRVKETAEIVAKTVSELSAKQEEERVKREEAETKRKEQAAKDEAEAKRREEALKPRFTGRDAKGNVVPKDYNELAEESARIGREQALQEFDDREKQKAQAADQTRQQEEAAKADREKRRQEFDQQLTSVLQEETNELFATGKLPKIVNPEDPNDPGNIALNELLKQGAAINEQRKREGKPVITSLTRIYTSYYKPPKPPAGGNAPVQGGVPTTPTNPNAEQNYDFKRFHNMPIPQFLAEMAKRRKA